VANRTVLSISFYGLPTDWLIHAIGSTGEGDLGDERCGRQLQVIDVRYTSFVCLSRNNAGFGIAKYTFNSRRRYEEQGCQEADPLVLEDGQIYDITSMEDDILGNLVALAVNRMGEGDIPEVLEVFESNE
jgi:hypothetical protein